MAVLKVRKRLVKKSLTQITNTLNEMKEEFLGAQARPGFKRIFSFIKGGGTS